MSPFAISALLVMLYSGADKKTRRAILDILQLRKRDVDKVARGFVNLSHLYEKWKIITPSTLFLAFDVYVNPRYHTDDKYEKIILNTFGKKVQKLDTREFLERMKQSSGSRLSSAEKLSNEEANMVGVAIASVEAAWDASEVYEYSIQPFEVHYGMKREQQYILIRARLRFYRNREHECWCIPLRAANNTESNAAQLDLYLIRPRWKGAVYNLQKAFDGPKIQEILFGIQTCRVAEHTILVPQMLLPYDNKDKRLVDMLTYWQQLKAKNNFNKISKKLKMDHCFHYTSMSITRRGVGFLYTPRERPITSFTQSSQNPHHYYPSPPDEPFAIRYDTPFLFMVYERTHRLPLIVGCYAGEPAIDRIMIESKTLRRMKTEKKKQKCKCNCCFRKPQVDK